MSFSPSLNDHFAQIAGIIYQQGETLEGNLICDIDPSNLIVERNWAKFTISKHWPWISNRFVKLVLMRDTVYY